MSEELIPNDDRVDELGKLLLECIIDFQNDRHAGKVSVQQSNWETLVALGSALSFSVASIDCDDCRRQMAEQAIKSLTKGMRFAITNPVNPDAVGHAH